MGELNKAWDVVLNINAIENLKIVEMTKEVFGIALKYSKKYGSLSNDAMHFAIMKKHRIKNITTNDKYFERVEWLIVWKP